MEALSRLGERPFCAAVLDWISTWVVRHADERLCADSQNPHDDLTKPFRQPETSFDILLIHRLQAFGWPADVQDTICTDTDATAARSSSPHPISCLASTLGCTRSNYVMRYWPHVSCLKSFVFALQKREREWDKTYFGSSSLDLTAAVSFLGTAFSKLIMFFFSSSYENRNSLKRSVVCVEGPTISACSAAFSSSFFLNLADEWILDAAEISYEPRELGVVLLLQF